MLEMFPFNEKAEEQHKHHRKRSNVLCRSVVWLSEKLLKFKIYYYVLDNSRPPTRRALIWTLKGNFHCEYLFLLNAQANKVIYELNFFLCMNINKFSFPECLRIKSRLLAHTRNSPACSFLMIIRTQNKQKSFLRRNQGVESFISRP